jgi:hypothetical protein
MGSGGFNRKAYVRQQGGPQRKSSGALGGLLFILLIAILGVLGFAGYKYVEANGLPDLGLEPSEPKDDMATVVAKLEEIEQRLARLENGRRAGSEASPSSESGTVSNGPAKSVESPKSGGLQTGGTPSSRSQPSGRQPTRSGVSDREAAYAARQHDKLADQVEANQERWDATSDRLTDTVTGLNEQRRESAEQRARLNKLWERFQRVPIDFALNKRDGKTRVGPVHLWLRKSDVKRHRYTLRVLVDDKWVEFKDRALMEPLEIYLRDVPVPVELLVSEIGRDRIGGTLGVPELLPDR